LSEAWWLLRKRIDGVLSRVGVGPERGIESPTADAASPLRAAGHDAAAITFLGVNNPNGRRLASRRTRVSFLDKCKTAAPVRSAAAAGRSLVLLCSLFATRKTPCPRSVCPAFVRGHLANVFVRLGVWFSFFANWAREKQLSLHAHPEKQGVPKTREHRLSARPFMRFSVFTVDIKNIVHFFYFYVIQYIYLYTYVYINILSNFSCIKREKPYSGYKQTFFIHTRYDNRGGCKLRNLTHLCNAPAVIMYYYCVKPWKLILLAVAHNQCIYYCRFILLFSW